MYKELVISIIIIILIVIADFTTNKYLEYSIQNMQESLSNLQNSVLREEKNDIEISMRNSKLLWESLGKKLSYFYEHDELEKVNVKLSSIDGNIKVGEYKQTMQYIEECVFILNHIKDKEKLYLENIF